MSEDHLPHHVPCYKAFYLDQETGLLYTLNGGKSVALRHVLEMDEPAKPLTMCEQGVHFCVTVEDCLGYYTDEFVKGRKRIITRVEPLGGPLLFSENKYCVGAVRVLEILPDSFRPCLFEAIQKAGCDPSLDDNLAICWASRFGHTETLKLLLADSRVDPTVWDNLAIRWASRFGHTERVEVLLTDSRIDPTVKDNHAIRLASRFGHTETLKLLLTDSRVDPTVCDNEAIRFASHYGHTETLEVLLADSRVDPTAFDNEAIRWASANGHTETMEVLLTDS